MDADFTSAPEAFARANREADEKYLKSLTVETAAVALEDLLSFWQEFAGSIEGLNSPPPLPNPLPGPTLAVLLTGGPLTDE
jgi:hypothetical protein